MAQVPPYEVPEGPPPPARRSNTIIWIIVIVCAGGVCLLLTFLAAILYPVFSQAKLAAQRSACMNNIRQLSRANLIYAGDNSDCLPPRDDWYSLIAGYSGRSGRLRCPIAVQESGSQAIGYGFNGTLTKKTVSELTAPNDIILLFESKDVSPNVSGGKAELVTPGRHGTSNRGNNFGYCDGSAKFIRDLDAPGNWKP